MRGVGSLGGVLFFLSAACASVRPPPPPPPEPPPSPIVAEAPRDARDAAVPRSIRRLLAEHRTEVDDMIVLAKSVGDARGRARAVAEATELSTELSTIEALIDAGEPDSDRLDETMRLLAPLSTRIALLHDALRVAAGRTAALEPDGS